MEAEILGIVSEDVLQGVIHELVVEVVVSMADDVLQHK
jgi:hypothetical protein